MGLYCKLLSGWWYSEPQQGIVEVVGNCLDPEGFSPLEKVRVDRGVRFAEDERQLRRVDERRPAEGVEQLSF